MNKEELPERKKGGEGGRRHHRRHRLVESLFGNVFDVRRKLIHPISCKFEEIINGDSYFDELICSMLGHPKKCPHGRPIPPGECCKKSKDGAAASIVSLEQMGVEQKGFVAYIRTRDGARLQKLTAMGVLPGMPIMMIQKSPSYVFQLGRTQFAVDRELAHCIYVTLKEGKNEG